MTQTWLIIKEDNSPTPLSLVFRQSHLCLTDSPPLGYLFKEAQARIMTPYDTLLAEPVCSRILPQSMSYCTPDVIGYKPYSTSAKNWTIWQ